MYKDTESLLAKGNAAVIIIYEEKSFSLSFHPNFLSNIYGTNFQRLFLYVSELITETEREPLVNRENKLVRTFLKGILKQKTTALPTNHRKLLQLILKIPTIHMDI